MKLTCPAPGSFPSQLVRFKRRLSELTLVTSRRCIVVDSWTFVRQTAPSRSLAVRAEGMGGKQGSGRQALFTMSSICGSLREFPPRQKSNKRVGMVRGGGSGHRRRNLNFSIGLGRWRRESRDKSRQRLLTSKVARKRVAGPLDRHHWVLDSGVRPSGRCRGATRAPRKSAKKRT